MSIERLERISFEVEYDLEIKKLCETMQECKAQITDFTEDTEAVRKYKAAASELCKKNYGFVFNIAKRYLHFMGSDLDLDDLIQEGMYGLIKAALKCQLDYDTTFLSYAGWWVRQCIHAANADTGHTVRMPRSTMELLGKIRRLDTAYSYIEEKERKETIADILNMPLERINEYYKYFSFLKIKSYDRPIEEDTTSLDELYVDTRSEPDFVDDLLNGLLRGDLNKIMERHLTQREVNVLESRFLGDRIKTLDEVGMDTGVTRERVRQIEAKALRKMRMASRKYSLKDYLYSTFV